MSVVALWTCHIAGPAAAAAGDGAAAWAAGAAGAGVRATAGAASVARTAHRARIRIGRAIVAAAGGCESAADALNGGIPTPPTKRD